MQASTHVAQSLIEKIHHLPPEKISQVLDFVEFLEQRQERAMDSQFSPDAARLSQDSFAQVWDNSEDADYDNL
jgi:hypothetical protein